MKVCIFTNHFFPEDFKVNDIAFDLQKRGIDVTVITAVPDYPKGQFFEGYSWFKRARETVNGVKVIRLPIIPRGKGGAIKLILNYVSYTISSRIFTFFHKFFHKYDAVFVHLTSPFFIGKCAVSLKRWQKIPLYFWTLDLWPESLTAAAGISNPVIIKPQIRMVQKIYDNCDKILIGSKGFEKSILEKGDYKDKLVYFPNWAESADILEKEEWKEAEPFCNFCEDDFIFLFAGNIGESQNIDYIIDSVNEFKENQNIKFVFLGDGRAREHLIQKVISLGLEKIVYFPGRFPLESMPYFMNKADVLMVSLKNELIFSFTVPGKVQFYMAQGKPILAMLNGDGADLINEAQCGIAVPANDKKSLIDAINRFISIEESTLNNMGLNGKKYYTENFRKDQRIQQLINLLQLN